MNAIGAEVDQAHAAIDQHVAANLYLYFVLTEHLFRQVVDLSLMCPPHNSSHFPIRIA